MMKKFLVIFMILFLLACEQEAEGYQYDDLDALQVASYLEGETFDGKYVLYYYSETCPGCNSVKQEIIPFFMNFDVLDVYLLNVADMVDVSVFTEFIGTPSVFIIDGSKTLYETYIGVDEVRMFMDKYQAFDFSLELFSSELVTTLEAYQGKEAKYTFLYEGDYEIGEELGSLLFGLESSKFVMIDVEQADALLLEEFTYDMGPMMIVQEEDTRVVIKGAGSITEYLEE